MERFRTRFSSATAAVFLPQVLARVFVLIANAKTLVLTSAIAALIVRGFASDLAIAGLIGLIWTLLPVSRLPRVLSWVLLTVWTYAAAANAEHILINFANVDFAFRRLAVRSEFLWTGLLAPQVVAKTAVLVGVLILADRIWRRSANLARLGAFLSPILFGFALLFSICVSPSIECPTWVSMNFFEDNARDATWPSLEHEESSASQLDPDLLKRYFQVDLNGRSILNAAAAHTRQNVLILVIEGMNRADFDRGHYPRLRERAQNALFYPNFLTHQKQTNRGLFAISCGDLPELVSKEAKSDLMGTFGYEGHCLPQVLAGQGYDTSFLESAPLGFMQKDRFAEAAGFQEAQDSSEATSAYSRNGWGVDDRTLFEEVLAEAQQRSKHSNKPWMQLVLTSGTHFPYNVPESFAHDFPKVEAQERAENYLDFALNELLEKMASEGLLQNTLVLITGDESTPSAAALAASPGLAVYNQTILLALTPGGEKANVPQVFAHSDIKTSVLDYLGYAVSADFGRSVFREYSSPRSVVFANIYSERIFELHEDGSLLVCTTQFNSCLTTKALDSRAPAPNDMRRVADLRAVARFSDRSTKDNHDGLIFQAHPDPIHGSKIVLGQFKIEPTAGDLIHWKVRARAASTNTAQVTLLLHAGVPDLEDGTSRERIIVDERGIAPGQVIELDQAKFFPADSWIWTSLEVRSQGQELFLEDVQITRTRAAKAADAFDHSHLSLPGTGPWTLNLLSSSENNDCLSATPSTCPSEAMLLSPLPTEFDHPLHAVYELRLQAVEGAMVFEADLQRAGKVLSSQHTSVLQKGQSATLHIEANSPDRVLPTFGLVSLSKTAKFQLQDAKLTLSTPVSAK